MEEINIITENDEYDEDDILFKKIFSIEFQEVKISKAIMLNDLISIFILFDGKIYILNPDKKELKLFYSCEYNKIINIFSNCNNSHLIILHSNGEIKGTNKKNLIEFEYYDKKSSKINNLDNLNIYTSEDLFKIITIEKEKISLFYTNEIIKEELNENIIKHKQFSTVIYLENERKNLINSKSNYFENYDVIFGNSMYNGNFAKIIYSIIEYIDEIKAYKIYLIEYTFLFEQIDRNNFINTKPTYYKKYFNSKYVYSYFKKEENEKIENNIYEQNIIIKSNKTGTCTAFIINNCPEKNRMNLIIFNNETYNFTFFHLENLFKLIEENVTVSDFDWLSNNDIFIFIQFSNYAFTILNTVNFQKYIINNNFMNYKEIDGIYILKYYKDLSKKIYEYQKISLLTNIRIEESKINEEEENKEISTLFLYSNSYIIYFDISTINYDNKIINLTREDSFEKFIISLKYFQSYYIKNEEKRMNLEEYTHNYIFNHFKLIFPSNNINLDPELIDLENSMAAAQDENLAQALYFYVNFIRIFQNINQYHCNDLTLISFLILISNDFFFYLLSLKEIWLSYLFLILSEKYLLSNLQLKKKEEIKHFDKEKLTNQKIFFLFNPKYANASSIKCYNKISNISLFSKLRVLLFFYSLVEFRNSQALNINVLYFILAKISIEELKKNNIMDDVNFLLKLIIQNWKFLKSENQKAGNAEFVLNNFSQNFTTEIFNFGIKKKEKNNKQFDYLIEIYTEEQMMIFNDINYKYCIKEEENDDNIINDFNSLDNDIGIIQKWDIYFKNFFYEDLFDDLNQYHEINKEDKICNFRLFFFISEIQLYFINLLEIIVSKDRNNVKYVKMISPIDIPFIIYEYSFIYDKNIKENEVFLTHDCHLSLINLINRYLKFYPFHFKESSLEFCEYLMMKGFNNLVINNNDKNFPFQPYISSAILFILISTLKVNSYVIIEKYFSLFEKCIKMLKNEFKNIIYSIMIYIIKFFIQYYSDIGKKYLYNHMLKLFLLYNRILDSIIDNYNLHYVLFYFLYETRVPDIKNFFEEKIIYNSYKRFKTFCKENSISNVNLFLNSKVYLKDIFEFELIDYFLSSLNNIDSFEKFKSKLETIKEKFISFEEDNISIILKNYYTIKLLYYFFLFYLKDKILENKEEKTILCYYSLLLCLINNKNEFENFQKKFEPNIINYKKLIGEENTNIIIKNMYYSKLIYKEKEDNINNEDKKGKKINNLIILLNHNYFIEIFSLFINEKKEIFKSKKSILDKEIKGNFINIRNKVIELNSKLSQIFGVLDDFCFQFNDLFEQGNFIDLMNYINGKTINLGGIQNAYFPSLKDYLIIIPEYEKQINSSLKKKNKNSIDNSNNDFEIREENVSNQKLKIKFKKNIKIYNKNDLVVLIKNIRLFICKKIILKIFMVNIQKVLSLNELNLINSNTKIELKQQYKNSDSKKMKFKLYKFNKEQLFYYYEQKMIYKEILDKEKEYQFNYIKNKYNSIEKKLEKINEEIEKNSKNNLI